MRRPKRICGWCLVCCLLLNVPLLIGADMAQQIVETFKKSISPTEPLLAADITVADTFQAGAGTAIGLVELVQGDGYILHQKGKTAFRAVKDLPLFQGDTLITGPHARIQARLDDKSTFALTEHSKLILTKVFYKAATNERDSELGLAFGKARFKVVKVAEGSQYKVTTPTAVAGIRGSDFALMVFPEAQRSAATSLGQRLADLLQVSSAHAVVPLLPSTALLTGQATTISFSGAVGAAQTIGPLSTSVAASGAAAGSAMSVGAAVATGVLQTIGPNLAYMMMPKEML